MTLIEPIPRDAAASATVTAIQDRGGTMVSARRPLPSVIPSTSRMRARS